MLSAVKEVLAKDAGVKDVLEMEVEITQLKKLLATEIKLKEFLVQEIDLGNFLSKNKTTINSMEITEVSEKIIEAPIEIAEIAKAPLVKKDAVAIKKKRDLPAFDYTLIDTLHEEHKDIRFIFNQVMSFAIEKDYKKVAGQLEIFNKKISAHYQAADTKLYSYLKTYVQIKYPKREKAFTELSLEMKNISIEIYYVITQSPNIPLSPKTHNSFMKEFMAMGKLLNERIIREESMLFKMYQQTNAAKTIS